MTIGIPSYQRRDALRRLLESIDREILADPVVGEGVDVLVVLDGSSDGSDAMLDGLRLSVPLAWVSQANAGLAAARNVLLDRASGEILWYLDDDMLLHEGCLRAHREAHVADAPRIAVGPCRFPPDRAIVHLTREWADEVYARLERQGGTTIDPNDFSAANTSAPRWLYDELGGFDTRFVGWGGEDAELGIRIAEAGVAAVYLPTAIAWHHQERSVTQMLVTKVQEGRNTVRLTHRHPHWASHVLPGPLTPRRRVVLLVVLAVGTRGANVLARLLRGAATIETRVLRGRRGRVFDLAATVCLYVGILEQDLDGAARRHMLEQDGRARPGGVPRRP